jgi:hypothetical protein
VDFLLAERLGSLESVTFVPPTKDDAIFCINSGLRLEGTLRLKWQAHDAAIDLRITLPYHGVFIFEDKQALPGYRSGLWSWLPKLARRPGVWQVLKPSIGFPAPALAIAESPSRLEIVFDSEARFFFKRVKDGYVFLPDPVKRFPHSVVLWDASAWPAELTEYLQLKPREPCLIPRGHALVGLIDKIVQWASDHPTGIPTINGDALDFQELVTFEAWLTQHLPLRLAQAIAAHKNCAPKELTPQQRLDKLVGCAGDISQSLFPVRLLRQQGSLILFTPFNPIDAVSQLTRFDRYGLSGDPLEYLKPVVHQNHPSFFGPVCPVETPESKMVGITLHLSRAQRIGPNVLNVDAKKVPPRDTLGFAANLIPFFEYNDGTRNMMGAKNMKQALPILGRQVPAINPQGGQAILDAVRPLLDLGLVPVMQDSADQLATGKDLLVAYLPYQGLNFEDGIVARAGIAGDLAYGETVRIVHDLPHTYRRGSSAESPFSAMHRGLDTELVVKPGTIIRRGDPLAILIDTTKEKIGRPDDSAEVVLRYAYLEEGTVESASLKLDSLLGGRLTVLVRKKYPLAAGDKIMGRHGNKGVIARLLPDDQMPRLPDHPGLPAAMRNRSVDLLLNPHGVISRMNLGQLIEAHLGWLHYAGRPLTPPLDCAPFAQQVRNRADDISRALAATGLDAAGRIALSLPDGGTTAMPVVVGFQHIIRLRHIPTKKIQARLGGAEDRYDPRTGQPVKGRAHLGGQRMGEMEVWALAAHRAPALIQDLLQHRSIAPGEQASAQHTWQAVRDHFFAVGIEVKRDKSGVKFSVLQQAAKEWSQGAVMSERTIETALKARFRCPICETTPPHLDGGFEVEDEKVPKLQLGTLLRAWQLTWSKPPQITSDAANDITATWKLKCSQAAGSRIEAAIKCRENKSSFRLEIDIPLSAGDRRIVTCTARKPNPNDGATRESLFGPFTEATKHLQRIEEVSVTCPKHSSQALVAVAPRRISRPFQAGLYCADIFGKDPNGRTRWGHIVLPIPVENPVFKILPQFKKDSTKIPKLKTIPVLPLVYRRPRRDSADEDRLKPDDLTRRGYASVVRAIETYQRYVKRTSGSDPKKLKDAVYQIQQAVDELFKLLSHRIADKETGLIRQHALGRRADRSGRAVIVPAPELFPDQCRVPAKVIVTIAGNEIADDFQANCHAKDREAICVSLRLGHLPAADLESIALDGIRNFFHRHPEKLVLLNRQPSLHKYSILAFRPVISNSDDVIGLHPLACAPLGADFDGDEITIHWPSTTEAQKDAAKLLLENNLISAAHGQSVVQFSQDLVLGLFLLRRAGQQQTVLDALPKNCRTILADAPNWTAKEINACLTCVAKKHPAQALTVFQNLMQLSLASATRHGTSFGYFDCLACQPSAGASCPVADAVQEKLRTVLAERKSGSAQPLGSGIAEMVLSKARGDKQVSQLVAQRGVLSPGLVSFHSKEENFTFTHSLADGCDAETFYRTAYNNRSSQCDKKLGTGKAGGLFRSMVGLLWDLIGKNGEPIGLLAAQSIGERGTQLSMQSFHTGKKGFTADQVRDLILKRSWSSADELIAELSKVDAYKDLDPRHFVTLFAGLKRRNAAMDVAPPILRSLAFSGQERLMKLAAQAALSKQRDDARHPVTSIMLSGLAPTGSKHG